MICVSYTLLTISSGEKDSSEKRLSAKSYVFFLKILLSFNFLTDVVKLYDKCEKAF